MTDGRVQTDRLVAGYAVLSAVALAFPGRPDSWPVIAAGHLALLALALAMGRMRHAAAGPAIRVVADWYPLLVIPLLYSELGVLNRAVWGGRYFDSVILAWEQAIFGAQPAASFAAAAPHLALSEALHAAYLSYYPIIYLPSLVLYLRGRRDAFASLLRPLVATFLLHYLVFVYFPVQGPRYLFPAPGGTVADGPLYQLTHRILEAGSSQGSAFPSSHMGVAVAQTVAAFRFLPRAAPLVLLASVGLGVGAVYGGFHYAIDMIVGALVGLAIGVASLALDRRVRTR